MKKILLITLLSMCLFSCKENTIRTTKEIEPEKDYREVTYDTTFHYGFTQIKYELKTKDYTLSYYITQSFDTWYPKLEFNVPLGEDYRLTIDNRDLFYEKYHDGSGSGLKDGFNAKAANGGDCKDCVSDVKYTKAYDRHIGSDFEVYIINEMKNAKKVTLQLVGEKPRELKIQKDAAEFITAYNKSLTTKVDWKQLEKDKYKQ